jgi:hypothetical protein
MRININSLIIKDKTQVKMAQIFRIQVFLVEKAAQNQSALKFIDQLYSGQFSSRQFMESH